MFHPRLAASMRPSRPIQRVIIRSIAVVVQLTTLTKDPHPIFLNILFTSPLAGPLLINFEPHRFLVLQALGDFLPAHEVHTEVHMWFIPKEQPPTIICINCESAKQGPVPRHDGKAAKHHREPVPMQCVKLLPACLPQHRSSFSHPSWDGHTCP